MLQRFIPSSLRAPATMLAAVAEDAREIEQQEREQQEDRILLLRGGHPQSAQNDNNSAVQGRVFDRLRRFQRLDPQLQLQANAFVLYLISPEVQHKYFVLAKTWPWKRKPYEDRPRIQGHRLMTAIRMLLARMEAGRTSASEAKRIAEALVLNGFLTPLHESEGEVRGSHYFQNVRWYEVVAPGISKTIYAASAPAEALSVGPSGQVRHSVWSVSDGATRANFVFRQRMNPVTRVSRRLPSCLAMVKKTEQPFYAVVNGGKHQLLCLFAHDLARESVAQLYLPDALVQYECPSDGVSTAAPCLHAIRVWTDEQMEVLDFVTKHAQDEWLLSLLDAGAKYKENHQNRAYLASSSVSFYCLTDVDANGHRVSMQELRGRVVLLVNVASQDVDAHLHIPELVDLALKYQHQGLEIVLFPNEQLGAHELLYDIDIQLALDQLTGSAVRLNVMRKADVNGPDARDVFVYLNAHLPGTFGPFVDWQFTRFLVDRRGRPAGRYEPTTLPRVLDEAIWELLQQAPSE